MKKQANKHQVQLEGVSPKLSKSEALDSNNIQTIATETGLYRRKP
jgi:hypothetical protein